VTGICRSGLALGATAPMCPEPPISADEAHDLFVSAKWCRAHAEQLSRAFHDLNPDARRNRARIEAKAAAAKASIDELAIAMVEVIEDAASPIRSSDVAASIGLAVASGTYKEACARVRELDLARQLPTGRWTTAASKRVEKIDRAALADRLVEVINGVGGPVQQPRLREALGVGTGPFQDAAKIALDDGRILRLGGPDGGYAPGTYRRDQAVSAARALPGSTRTDLARSIGVDPATLKPGVDAAVSAGLLTERDGRYWPAAEQLAEAA